ncbi:hypothetical protein [Nocardia sp. NPDC055049]
MAHFLGAALDQCITCEETALALLAESASTTAYLIEIACAAVLDTLKGFPIDLIDTSAEHSLVPRVFRHAAVAFTRNDRPALAQMCEQASPAQRHAAARTATGRCRADLAGVERRPRATAPR